MAILNTPVTLAIAYDFDGTLSPRNMQEYDFIPKIGMADHAFWAEVECLARAQEADRILAYMHLMLKKASAMELGVMKEDFRLYGQSVELFKGVTGWFERINRYAGLNNAVIEHYIISSGIKEMILGTPIAGEFKKIYASSFIYDHHGVAQRPGLAINYTTKTQFLFRINKGYLDVFDDSRINEYLPKEERPVPFENMIFIGDGETDIPCFRMVKDQGGHSIAVYPAESDEKRRRAHKLINEGRINFVCEADYGSDSEIDVRVKAIINKVIADARLKALGKKE